MKLKIISATWSYQTLVCSKKLCFLCRLLYDKNKFSFNYAESLKTSDHIRSHKSRQDLNYVLLYVYKSGMIRLDLTRIISWFIVRFSSYESCKICASIFQSESYKIFKKETHKILSDRIIRSYKKSCTSKILLDLVRSDVCFFDLGTEQQDFSRIL